MVVSLVIVGINGEGGVVTLHRFCPPAEMQEDVAANEMEGRIAGMGGDGLLGVSERFFEPMLLHQDVANVERGRWQIGIQRERLLIALERRVVPLPTAKNLAAGVPQVGVSPV